MSNTLLTPDSTAVRHLLDACFFCFFVFFRTSCGCVPRLDMLVREFVPRGQMMQT